MDVVGVPIHLGNQVVELRAQLAMQEVEVKEEKRFKEVRSWLTMEMK